MLWTFKYEPPKVGSEYKRRGETLTWLVLSFSDNDVRVSGPGGRTGIMWVARTEFNKNWVKA